MRARHGLALVAAALLTARLAAAQIVAVPTFTVGTPTFGSFIQDADVAVGTDGTMLFIWGQYNNHIGTDNNALRHVSATGTPLGPVLRGDTSAHVFDPVISSDTRGGYVGAWEWIINGREYEFFGRAFDGTGTGIGDDFSVDLDGIGPTESGAVAGLPSGAVFVWRQQNHLFGALYASTVPTDRRAAPPSRSMPTAGCCTSPPTRVAASPRPGIAGTAPPRRPSSGYAASPTTAPSSARA